MRCRCHADADRHNWHYTRHRVGEGRGLDPFTNGLSYRTSGKCVSTRKQDQKLFTSIPGHLVLVISQAALNDSGDFH